MIKRLILLSLLFLTLINAKESLAYKKNLLVKEELKGVKI